MSDPVDAGPPSGSVPADRAGYDARRVLALEAAELRCDAWRAEGLRVVLTNGCFDLLHVGHVRYLRAARALGDRLVVALNDDDSVAALKGVGRPIVSAAERAELLAALRAVDMVTIFEGPTAERVVEVLRPDVYTKGGDYGGRAPEPPEARIALALGAEVRYLNFVEGRSTRGLIDRIRASER